MKTEALANRIEPQRRRVEREIDDPNEIFWRKKDSKNAKIKAD
jgi:hypothetical protein